MSVYDYSYQSMEGKEISLAEYAGKVLLLVNTASKCGFTPQYAGLEALYKQYGARGLVVVGFPCNQFAHQEPGDEAEIHQFCQLRYGVTFPLSQKIDVNGEQEHPLYTWLKSQKSGVFGQDIRWNFTKFLLDRSGNAVARYAPTTKPEKLAADIEKLLGE